MKFCTKCGSKLGEGETICHNCGYNFNTKKYEQDGIDDTQQIDRFYKVRKKPLIISAVVVIALIVSFVLIGKSITNPQKIMARFESDIASGNKSDLSKILYSNDNRLKIDEENSSYLITYFKDNPSYLNKIVDNMDNQVQNMNSIKLANVSSSNFAIVVSGRTMVFFPKYKVNIRPAFININAGIKNVELSLDGNKIGKSDTDDFSREFGPFIPGKYKLHAVYNGKYVSLNKTYNVDLVDADNGKAKIDVFQDLSYVDIRGDYPDAEIFVNNRNTKVKISDAGNFGPVSPDTKIYAIANKNGKKLKSDEYTVAQGNTSVDLNFSNSEMQLDNMEDQIHNLVNMYTNNFCYAINYGDFLSVEPYIYPGSSLYSEQIKYIPDTYNKGINEDIMSYNVVSYNLSDDNKSGNVTTEEVYKITSNGQSSVKNFKYVYGFKYNENMGSYQLTSIKSVK